MNSVLADGPSCEQLITSTDQVQAQTDPLYFWCLDQLRPAPEQGWIEVHPTATSVILMTAVLLISAIAGILGAWAQIEHLQAEPRHPSHYTIGFYVTLFHGFLNVATVGMILTLLVSYFVHGWFGGTLVAWVFLATLGTGMAHRAICRRLPKSAPRPPSGLDATAW